MHRKAALAIAERLIEAMRPHCERIEIAGSLRREKAEVRDIEIVAIPRTVEVLSNVNLFEEVYATRNALNFWALTFQLDPWLRWIKPGTKEILPWSPKLDAKYLRGLVTPVGHESIKLDLFQCRAESWGIIHLIRTGSAEFSEAVVTHARNIGRPMAGGILTQDGQDIPTPEEQDVFDTLGLRYVEPRHRHSGAQVKRAQVAR